MAILNLTPHEVNLEGYGAIPSTGLARVRTVEVLTGDADGVPLLVVSADAGTVTGLPPAVPGVWLIVSQMVAAAMPHRRDLVFPAQLVRDDAGRIVGAAALGQVPAP